MKAVDENIKEFSSNKHPSTTQAIKDQSGNKVESVEVPETNAKTGVMYVENGTEVNG